MGNCLRELNSRQIASRKSIYGRLVDLSDVGILESAMVQVKDPEDPGHVKTWIKRYRIAEHHKQWIGKLISGDQLCAQSLPTQAESPVGNEQDRSEQSDRKRLLIALENKTSRQ